MRNRQGVRAENGGEPCSGTYEDYQPCNQHECFETIEDSALGEWTAWSACSNPCNGHKEPSMA